MLLRIRSAELEACGYLTGAWERGKRPLTPLFLLLKVSTSIAHATTNNICCTFTTAQVTTMCRVYGYRGQTSSLVIHRTGTD